MSSRSSRSTSTVVGLLVVALLFSTFLAPHLPAASARHVAVFKAKDDATGQAEAAGGRSSRPGRTSTVEMRGGDAWAAAEMQDMLKRDYAYKARRRSPIHNDEPLQENDEP
ncbi:uncharacterized protein LOC106865637 [Brachypodium distachyon]|uniref:Uncharacterized protein n=1 Tax=Brachypodium distachyon TaxID=15368 RepID=A0A0Q3E5Q0_BRADI|nr:uncharacterized protein LOC106865637 [Brachypodium distachyon]KQJ83054.1 hypothetical protein BRADI_5g12825v3 [Brachypodium distachyon]|eukprot:XP_014751628.1 uncharacterized protein LOC106865637 [Brachypodium distachyon]